MRRCQIPYLIGLRAAAQSTTKGTSEVSIVTSVLERAAPHMRSSEEDELKQVVEAFMNRFAELADSFELTPATGTRMVLRFAGGPENGTYAVNATATDTGISIALTELAPAEGRG